MLRALCSRTYLSASSRLSILRRVSDGDRMPRLGSPRTYSLGRITKSARVVITVNKPYNFPSCKPYKTAEAQAAAKRQRGLRQFLRSPLHVEIVKGSRAE